MARPFGRGRILRVLALGAGLAGCRTPSKPHLPAVPTPIPRVTVAVHADGKLATLDSRIKYDDRARDLVLEIPAGWNAATEFVAGEEGPPPAGELRLRARLGPDPFCVIDLALEPLPSSEEALRGSVARGRDVFFFAPTDDPASGIPGARQWASTAVPVTPGRTDLAYWVTSGDRLIRLEGRFPNDRVPECKDALDSILTSMGPRESGGGDPGAASGRRPSINPG